MTPITIHIPHSAAAQIDRHIEELKNSLSMDREELLAYLLACGIVWYLQENNKALERKLAAKEGCRKLRAELATSTAELDAIYYEAKAGNMEASIVMEDFKRFGRSMEKQRPADEPPTTAPTQ